MGFLSDVLDFEGFHLRDLGKKIRKDPERLLLGAVDPASTNLWNKATGKGYEPLVDQMGGAYGGHAITMGDTGEGVYGRARAAGVPTAAGAGMHDVAHVIASMFAGGYGAGRLGSRIPFLSRQQGVAMPQGALNEIPMSSIPRRMGTTTPTFRGPPWMQKLGGLFSDPQVNGGVFGEGAAPPQRDEMLAMASELLSGSSYAPYKRPFGETLGMALKAGMQQRALGIDRAQQKKVQDAQIAAANRQNNDPNSVREYEYAKAQGFGGSYEEWAKLGGQTSRPSSVQEWEFFSGLQPNDQERYLEMKRNPNFGTAIVDQVPTITRPTVGFGIQTTPLSTTQSEIDAAARRKEAEAQAAARGTVVGNIEGGIQKKGADAVNALNLIEMADPLIDASTGSWGGAARDAFAAKFGYSPDGAQAIAQLKVLQAGLMLSAPRMEGPQSNLDVQLYEQAVGQIGDPTIPRETRKAALRTVETIQNRYVERAAEVSGDADSTHADAGASAPGSSGWSIRKVD